MNNKITLCILLISVSLYAGTLTIDSILVRRGILLQKKSVNAIDFNRDRAIQRNEIVPDLNGDGQIVTKEIVDFAVANAEDKTFLRDVLSVFTENADQFLYPELYSTAAAHYRETISVRMRELSLRAFREEYAKYNLHNARHIELSQKRESMIKETFDASLLKVLDAEIAREGLLREQSGGRLSRMGAHPLMGKNQFYLPDGDLVRVADRKTDVKLHTNGSVRSIRLYRPLERTIMLNKKQQKVILEKEIELYENGMWRSFQVVQPLVLVLRDKKVEGIRQVFLSPKGGVEGYAADDGKQVLFEKRSAAMKAVAIPGESTLDIPAGTPRVNVGRSVHFDTIGDLHVHQMFKLLKRSWYLIDADKSSLSNVKFLSGRIEAPAKSVFALRFDGGFLSQVIFRDSARPLFSANVVSRMTGAPRLFDESNARVTKIIIDDIIHISLDAPLFVIEEEVLVVPSYEIELTKSGGYLRPAY